MVPGRRYNVRYLLRTLRKRWWMILLPLLVTGAIGAVLAKALPNVYYTQTTVVIVPQRIPESYVRSTVTVSLAERLVSTSQQVLSRTQLEQLIYELNLFPALRERVPMEALILWFRSGIRVEMTQGNAFIVGFSGYGPEQVRLVTDKLTDLFIREGRREREMLADSTSQFLENELQAARQRLEIHDKRVEEYRRTYAGELPSQLEANLRILQSTSAQLQGVAEALNRDRDRREALSRELAALSARQEPAAPVEPEPLEPVTDAPVPIPSGPPSVQLKAARAARQKLLLRVTSEHPDVIALDRVIARLESAAVGRTTDTSGVTTTGEPPRAAELRQLLAVLDQQIAVRQGMEKKLREGVAAYQSRVESVPQRESEWIQLTRDYDTLRGVYSGLLAKREESRIAANLERQQVGEQFRIVERPVAPTRPVSPNRPMIVLVSVGVGLGLGFGMVILLELRRSGLYAEEEVVAALNLPVVGLVPMIVTGWDRRRARRRKLIWSAAAAMACLFLVAVRWVR